MNDQNHSDGDRKLDEVHLAVCGNKRLGVPGLVQDVRELKEWRRNLDLRTAAISGGITAVVLIAKAVIHF